MTPAPLAAVVMAAGLGTRMRSSRPKHLHELLGRRMVDWVLEALVPLAPAPSLLVCSPEAKPELGRALRSGVSLVVQGQPLGTGHAVLSSREALAGFEGDLLVLAGDTPLLTSDVLAALVAAHRRARPAVTVLSFEPVEPGAYGRIIRGPEGRLSRIVEAADASPAELAVREVNSSVYVFALPGLWEALERLEPANAKGELYLTDAVRLLVEAGRPAAVEIAPVAAEVEGVNTRAELARAAAALRDRVALGHMLAGVAIVDPSTTWIDVGVELEPDAVVHPFTVLRGSTRVGAGAEVGPHVVAVDAEIGAGASVGPFCYLRPGARLGEGAKAGSFVEVKNSTLGAGAKVPHLSYIGDAEVGEGTNVAAGAITANYRPELGEGKQRTVIGRDVHTGSHNVFVAPVEIGDGAWIAAGSTITEDVPPGALAIARARQVNREGYRGGPRRD